VIEVSLVVLPGFQMMVFASLSVFEIANVVARDKLYDIHVVSEGGGPVLNSLEFSINTERFDTRVFDTLLVGGRLEAAPSSARLIDFVRNALPRCRRIASICTGAFILAEAGLLDGRRATTHWAYARELQRQFPKVKVEKDRIFIVDGSVWTSAGMTAGVDLALGMVEKDFGREMARLVARNMVVYNRRAGGQSQRSALLEMDAKSDRIQRALDYAKRNLSAELSVKELAEAARLSPRQFSRVLRAETRQSPAKAIEHLRIEGARLMLEQSRHPIDVIAVETGFVDPERMRRAFLRAFGQPPQVMRRNARVDDPV
jgi:transcriptional regulator GlxA family with amidase domain